MNEKYFKEDDWILNTWIPAKPLWRTEFPVMHISEAPFINWDIENEQEIRNAKD